jgi:hypothetical protein
VSVWKRCQIKKKKKLINKLNKWQNFRTNNKEEIEFLVLNRAIQKFNGNQNDFEETIV